MQDIERYDAMIEAAGQENEEDETQIAILQSDVNSRKLLIQRWQEKRARLGAYVPASVSQVAADELDVANTANRGRFRAPVILQTDEVVNLFSKNEFKTLTQKNAAFMIVQRVVQELHRPITIDEGVAALDWVGNPIGGKTRQHKKQNMSTLLKRSAPELASAGRGFYTLGVPSRGEAAKKNDQNVQSPLAFNAPNGNRHEDQEEMQ